MLTTVPDILSFVKSEYRITDTSLDAYIQGNISRNYFNRSKRFPWKETIVQGTTFAAASSTQFYATSSNFIRLVPNSVRYGISSGTLGVLLPDIEFEQYEYYRQQCTGADPQWVTVTGSTAGKSLMLFPAFTNSSSVVTYDYYAQPTSLSTSATLPIPELGDAVAYDTLADVAGYHEKPDRQAIYAGQAKEQWKSAFQSIL